MKISRRQFIYYLYFNNTLKLTMFFNLSHIPSQSEERKSDFSLDTSSLSMVYNPFSFIDVFHAKVSTRSKFKNCNVLYLKLFPHIRTHHMIKKWSVINVRGKFVQNRNKTATLTVIDSSLNMNFRAVSDRNAKFNHTETI